MTTRDIWMLLFAVASAGIVAFVIAPRLRPLGLALRSMNREQRKVVLCIIAITAIVLVVMQVATTEALLASAAECDTTMFVAAHPKLPASDAASPETLAVRFVLLMREVSPSKQCNLRSLREAFESATDHAMRSFAEELKKAGTVEEFLERRLSENVSVEELALEQHSAAEWHLSWTEHVRSPAGVDLRTERYAGELRTRFDASSARYEVDGFQAHPAPLAGERADNNYQEFQTKEVGK